MWRVVYRCNNRYTTLHGWNVIILVLYRWHRCVLSPGRFLLYRLWQSSHQRPEYHQVIPYRTHVFETNQYFHSIYPTLSVHPLTQFLRQQVGHPACEKLCSRFAIRRSFGAWPKAAFTPDTCSRIQVFQTTCIRIQVDTCRRDDNFVADTGCM